jgi:hypothetical protein
MTPEERDKLDFFHAGIAGSLLSVCPDEYGFVLVMFHVDELQRVGDARIAMASNSTPAAAIAILDALMIKLREGMS